MFTSLFSWITLGWITLTVHQDQPLYPNNPIVPPGAPRVNILNGTVVGLYLPDYGQQAFLGIPFAQVRLIPFLSTSIQSCNYERLSDRRVIASNWASSSSSSFAIRSYLWRRRVRRDQVLGYMLDEVWSTCRW